MSYLVKCHYIINSLLSIENHVLQDLESALKYIETETADYIKIFDADGALVHTTEIDAVTIPVVEVPVVAPVAPTNEVPVETPVAIETIVVDVPAAE